MEIIYDEILLYYSDEIRQILGDKHSFYHTFSIPKRSGGVRVISEPLEPLKTIQRELLSNFFYPKRYLIHPCAAAYIPGKNPKQAIECHIGKDMVLHLDIKNFFGSVNSSLVLDSMRYTFRMDEKTAETITALCTLDDTLPQGSPVSPILSNYVCRVMDRRLFNYCRKWDISYSRYADDLIFSGSFDRKALFDYVEWALRDYYGFSLNRNKQRLMRKNQRQIVLGVLVNNRCRLVKEKRHELRQILYYMDKYGVEDYILHCACSPIYAEQLLGYVNYALSIEGEMVGLVRLKALLAAYLKAHSMGLGT